LRRRGSVCTYDAPPFFLARDLPSDYRVADEGAGSRTEIGKLRRVKKISWGGYRRDGIGNPRRVMMQRLPVENKERPLQAFVSRLQALLNSVRFWWALSIVYAAFAAWVGRYAMTGDGMSYLDMAAQALQTGPDAFVNGYWSPLYPVLIAAGLVLFRPSPALEFPVIHVVNFFIFLMVLFSFTFFYNAWVGARRYDTDGRETKPDLVPFAFGVFLWCILTFIPLGLSTPDLCVSGVVFAAAGICCRIAYRPSNWGRYVALGVVLGIGYYAKAVMLPLGMMLLGILLVVQPSTSFRRIGIGLSACVLLLTIAPLVSMISIKLGHFSSGETGPLNYAWYVNRLTWNGDWISSPGDPHGTSKHPPRVLTERPYTLEFAHPIAGTYPLWYDPAYWYAGATVRFSLRQQAVQIFKNLRPYAEACVQPSPLIGGLLGLVVFRANRRRVPSPSRDVWWMVLWPLGACAMYTLVHVDMRFLGAFVVILCLVLYEHLLRGVRAPVKAALLAIVLLSLFLPMTIGLVEEPILHTDSDADVIVGEKLAALGVNRGATVAIVGTGYRDYFARIAGVQIVAQVVQWDQLRDATEADFSALLDRLNQLGVKAFISPGAVGNVAAREWHEVAGSDRYRFSVLLLRPGPVR
jgi:hypothetical protein